MKIKTEKTCDTEANVIITDFAQENTPLLFTNAIII